MTYCVNEYLILCWKLCTNYYESLIIMFLVEFLWVKLPFALLQCFLNVCSHKNLLETMFRMQILGPYLQPPRCGWPQKFKISFPGDSSAGACGDGDPFANP